MKWQQEWNDTKKSELTLKYPTYHLLEYIHGTSQDGNKLLSVDCEPVITVIICSIGYTPCYCRAELNSNKCGNSTAVARQLR